MEQQIPVYGSVYIKPAPIEDWRTICIINKNHETMEIDGEEVPVWLVAGKEKDGTHHLLRIHGPRVRPSFGVPYEEFWKVMGDSRLTGYKRGPDSPFGEPTIEVFTKLPKDIGTGEAAMRNFVGHSYQGDVRFEDKAGIDLHIWEGYLMFDAAATDSYGYVDDEHIKPPPEGFEKFHVPKRKIYFDSEWNMKGLMNSEGRLSFRRSKGEKEDRTKYTKVKVITISFLQSWDWTFHVFTWHPRVTQKCTYQEKFKSRISEAARKKIPKMPQEYECVIHACENEKQLLVDMVDYLSGTQWDAIVGFNAFSGMHGIGNDKKWIAGFDMPWLYRHCMVKPEKGFEWRPRDLDVNLHRISPVGVTYMREEFGKEDVVIRMVTCLDVWHMMAFFEYHKKYKLKNEKLDTFMWKFLGIGKHQRQERYVWDTWEKDPKDERLYNMADTEGTAGIEQLFGPSEDCFNRATFAGASWDAGMAASRMHDLVNLHLYKDLYYLDTKTYGDNKYDRIWLWNGFGEEKVGGFNKEPIPGMHRLSFGLDFNKFYPMAGILTNCSPETFVNMDHIKITKKGLIVVEKKPYLKKEVGDWDAFIKECRAIQAKEAQVPENALSLQGVVTRELIGWKENEYLWGDLIVTPAGLFRKDIIARNVKAFMDMLKGRKALQKVAEAIFEKFKDLEMFEYKVADQRQFSFKGFMNGRFGVQGMEGDRIYMLALFNSYTMVCQEIIIECVRYVEEELGYPVSLSSTDSLYANHKRPIEWLEKVIKKPDGTEKVLYYSKEAEDVAALVQKHAQDFARREFNISDTSMFTLECDVICKTMFVENMRFYIKNVMWKGGEILDPPQLEFKGMKKVRREVAQVTEDVQQRLAFIYMNDGTMEDVVKEVNALHEGFAGKPLIDSCRSLPVNKPYEEYEETSEQFKSFALADRYFGMDVVVGDRFYIAPLKYCPPMINGKKVDKRLGDTIAFDEESLKKMIDAGIQVDYNEIEDKAVASPADEILEMFGTSYWKVLSKARVANTHGEF
jgi:DNA polymerase elongation subunit (family B)